MHYHIRPDAQTCTFRQAPDLQAIQRVVPLGVIQAALTDTHRTARRVRKLSLEWVVLLLIGMHLYAELSLGALLERLISAQRLAGTHEGPPPTESALVYRRYQLGARPMAALFRRVVRPIATRQTRGAFLGELRLLALDGFKQDLPDTPENAAYFGRPRTDRGAGAFPQALIVWLCEGGTHATLDAGVWPCHTSERVGARRLMRSVEAGMLLMFDAGLYSFDLLERAVQRGAHVLARLPAGVKPVLERRLSDGSELVWISASGHKAKKAGEGRLVRLIRYRIEDPHSPQPKQVYRLVTTLLDERAYPAEQLAGAYHERWEIEGATDEIQTHQQGPARLLRSRKPVGVVQEIYALLLAHYVVRFLMHEAAIEADCDPDRISFCGTLRVVQQTLPLLLLADAFERPCIYARMIDDIARQRLPQRRPRCNARAVKRKMSGFPLKRPGKAKCVRLQRHFQESIRLI